VRRVRRTERDQQLRAGGLEDHGENSEDVAVDVGGHALRKNEVPGHPAERYVDGNVAAILGELAAGGIDVGRVQRRVGTARYLGISGRLHPG
jgi:hypothetical protein